ncbi:hypothetical protein EP7_004161 [Isosphaeraceae bacterium EP7]
MQHLILLTAMAVTGGLHGHKKAACAPAPAPVVCAAPAPVVVSAPCPKPVKVKHHKVKVAKVKHRKAKCEPVVYAAAPVACDTPAVYPTSQSAPVYATPVAPSKQGF